MKLFKHRSCFIIMPMAVSGCFISCSAQEPFGTNLLKPEKEIVLPAVKGRIDHMDINLKARIVYVAALGNNSLEAVSLTDGKIIHSIHGLDEPQGVGYIPQRQEIIVANGGSGDCYFYNANSFEKVGTLHLSSDADDIRYDSIDKKIYIGYGSGGIAEIDPIRRQKTTDVKLPEHPEGFQLDKSLKKIFVNVPDANQIDVIDLKSREVVAKWKTDYNANFPMAIDESRHIIFIGYRHPAKLVALDENNGRTIAATDLIGDADDLYFDGRSKKIYASGGGGAINVYLFENSAFRQITAVATHSGARTSLLIPALNTFILAERATGNDAAQLNFYKTK